MPVSYRNSGDHYYSLHYRAAVIEYITLLKSQLQKQCVQWTKFAFGGAFYYRLF